MVPKDIHAAVRPSQLLVLRVFFSCQAEPRPRLPARFGSCPSAHDMRMPLSFLRCLGKSLSAWTCCCDLSLPRGLQGFCQLLNWPLGRGDPFTRGMAHDLSWGPAGSAGSGVPVRVSVWRGTGLQLLISHWRKKEPLEAWGLAFWLWPTLPCMPAGRVQLWARCMWEQLQA